jgi:uncharacterized protein
MSNEDVLRRAYQAFNEGDIGTLSELFADGVVWTTPGSNAVSGTYNGRAATFGMFGKLGEVTEGTYRSEAQSIEVDGDNATVRNHTTGKRDGQVFDATSTIRFRLSGGQIVEATEAPDDQAEWDKFLA